jgi:hypothetical protein
MFERAPIHVDADAQMVGEGDVHHASALMRQDHEDEEQAVRRGLDDEEIRCHDLADVICEECSPRLGRWVPPPRHVLRHSALTDVDPEFQEFAVDSGCAQSGFATDIVRIKARTSRETVGRPRWCRLFQVQVPAKATTMPRDDRVGFDEDQGRSPGQTRESQTHRRRSLRVSPSRRVCDRSNTWSWCRNASTSNCRAARDRTELRNANRKAISTDFMKWKRMQMRRQPQS